MLSNGTIALNQKRKEMNTETIKSEIKKSYGAIAKGNLQAGCCSADTLCCPTDEFGTSMTENYGTIEGYQKEADLSLGCGLPTEIANIKEGIPLSTLGRVRETTLL